jgi:hypothetical protein
MSNSKNHVVIVRVVGGLGNQMFQYACARAEALRCNGQLLLDLSAFKQYRLHQYGLDSFCITAPAATGMLQTGSRLHASLRRFGLSRQLQMRLQGVCYIKEPDNMALQPRMQGNHAKIYLDGYWQNEAYFADASDIIRAEFQLPRPGFAPNVRTLLDNDLPIVSLHIRRGDYVTNPMANAVHGVLHLDYYRDAIEMLVKHLGERFQIVVFSDDIEWARQKLICSQPLYFIPGSTVTPHEDLHMMASCDHHIIANSSFSWWGAWLNPSASKIVIAPKRWFIAPQFRNRDICPPSWVQI